MCQHIEQLCHEHQIACYVDRKRPGVSYSLRECDEIRIAPIRSSLSYAIALHEVGHMLGRHQQSRWVMVRERWAWNWARKNALFWSPAMEWTATDSLEWYRPRAARLDRKRMKAALT
jgi:hypothetical protein